MSLPEEYQSVSYSRDLLPLGIGRQQLLEGLPAAPQRDSTTATKPPSAYQLLLPMAEAAASSCCMAATTTRRDVTRQRQLQEGMRGDTKKDSTRGTAAASLRRDSPIYRGIEVNESLAVEACGLPDIRIKSPQMDQIQASPHLDPLQILRTATAAAAAAAAAL